MPHRRQRRRGHVATLAHTKGDDVRAQRAIAHAHTLSVISRAFAIWTPTRVCVCVQDACTNIYVNLLHCLQNKYVRG